MDVPPRSHLLGVPIEGVFTRLLVLRGDSNTDRVVVEGDIENVGHRVLHEHDATGVGVLGVLPAEVEGEDGDHGARLGSHDLGVPVVPVVENRVVLIS